jgi:hypothetical protein
MDKDNYPNAGGLYIEKSKTGDLQNARYWVVSAKEEKEEGYITDERGYMPVILRDFDVKSLLDIQIFQDIIDLKMENNPELKLEQTDVFLEAILYYLEHDDFMD